MSGWKSFREDRYTANTKACRPRTTVTGLQVNDKAGSLLETISFAMSRTRRGRCAVFFSRVGATILWVCSHFRILRDSSKEKTNEMKRNTNKMKRHTNDGHQTAQAAKAAKMGDVLHYAVYVRLMRKKRRLNATSPCPCPKHITSHYLSTVMFGFVVRINHSSSCAFQPKQYFL